MPTVGQLPRKASYLRASQASTLDPQPSRLRVCVFLTPRPIATPLPYRFNLYTLPLTLAAIVRVKSPGTNVHWANPEGSSS